MKESTVCIIVAIIFIVIAITCIVFGKLRDSITTVLVGLIFVCLFALTCCITVSAKQYEKINALKSDSNVEWFLDGQPVNPDNISVYQYSATTNADQTKVYLTRKQSD